MPVILLRHGHIQRPAERTYIGQLDVPLSELGWRQAWLWAEKLASQGVTAVHASDLRRAGDFGGCIARRVGCPLVVDPRWREIFLGDWEGRSMHAVQAEAPELYAARGESPNLVRPPGGEHFGDVLQRVLPACAELWRADQTGGLTVVITHAGVIRTLRCHVESRPLENVLQLAVPLASAWEFPGGMIDRMTLDQGGRCHDHGS